MSLLPPVCPRRSPRCYHPTLARQIASCRLLLCGAARLPARPHAAWTAASAAAARGPFGPLLPLQRAPAPLLLLLGFGGPQPYWQWHHRPRRAAPEAPPRTPLPLQQHQHATQCRPRVVVRLA
eukprot:1190456-Prorocentrum_minimum.AAC.1